MLGIRPWEVGLLTVEQFDRMVRYIDQANQAAAEAARG